MPLTEQALPPGYTFPPVAVCPVSWGTTGLSLGPFFLLPLTETVMPWEWQLKTELEQALCVKYPDYIPLR